MAAIFSFKCSKCGKVHEGSPSIAFRAPDPFLEQPKEIQDAGQLTEDFCRYQDDDGMHYFIRVCLEVPIHGVTEPFLWGVWVSLSESSFNRYREIYNASDTNDRYFGWLCNYLPGYKSTYAIKTQVLPQPERKRPLITLEETDHPLCIDFRNGISIEKAQALAEQASHR